MGQKARKPKRSAAAKKPAARAVKKVSTRVAAARKPRVAKAAVARSAVARASAADAAAPVVEAPVAAPQAESTGTTEVMSHSYRMDRQCTLREAEAFKSALLAAEDSSGDFVVHAGDLERIDTAGLQLLLGFAARLRLVDRRLVWSEISPALRRSAEQLGLAEALELP